MSRMGQEFIRMQEAGEIPHGTSVTDMIPVRCGRCHWSGYTPQLKLVYKPNPERLGDVIPTPGCPACLSDQYLEHKDEMYYLQSLANERDRKQYELEKVIGYKKDLPF